MSAETHSRSRLETWKEIAAFLRCDERTVKRWEVDRGLPIHRLPGGGRSRVFAEVDELEAWRRSTLNEARSEPPPVLAAAAVVIPSASSAAAKSPRRVGALAAMAVGVAIIAAVVALAWPRLGHTPPLKAQALYVAGMNDWAARSPASLDRAFNAFNAAIALDPNYAQAYAGLAECYDLMPEYTLMAGSQAFPLARTAAQRAIALDPGLADAHAALAFAEFYGFWDAAAARREFKRAVALDPKSINARHWFATFLRTQGDNAGALREIDAALSIDPESPAIAADRAVIMATAGRQAAGVAALIALEAAHPEFLSPHRYLAEMALVGGRDDVFLRESAWLANKSGDFSDATVSRAAAEGFRTGGRAGLLAALLTAQTRAYENGAATAYSVARLRALIGDQSGALAFLRIAKARRELQMLYLGIDDAFASLRSRPDFRNLLPTTARV